MIRRCQTWRILPASPVAALPDHARIIPQNTLKTGGTLPVTAVLMQSSGNFTELHKSARIDVRGGHFTVDPMKQHHIAAFGFIDRQGLHLLPIHTA